MTETKTLKEFQTLSLKSSMSEFLELAKITKGCKEGITLVEKNIDKTIEEGIGNVVKGNDEYIMWFIVVMGTKLDDKLKDHLIQLIQSDKMKQEKIIKLHRMKQLFKKIETNTIISKEVR